MKDGNCYLCESSSYDIVYAYDKPDHYQAGISDQNYIRELRVCKACGLVYNYSNHTVDDDFYKNTMWSKELHGNDSEQLFYAIASLPPHKSENLGRTQWLKQKLNELSYAFDILLDKKKKVLDIGCGLGIFLNAFIDDEWEGYGIEPSKNACRVAEEKLNIPIHCGSYSPDTYQEKFHLVSLIHVLEHFEDPVGVLSQIRDNLCDKGALFIEVPEVLELCYSDKYHEAFNSGHFFLFSPGSLLSVVQRAGYLPVVIEREKSPRPRRRIKLLAIKDQKYEAGTNLFYESYEQILSYRDRFLKTRNE